jgi:transcriptional regulator with XRE-family HTH domain
MTGLTTFAERLNYLFDTVLAPNQRAYSNEDVAAAISGSDSGATISATYIWMLRKGQRDNPTLKHVEALARFFDVPPAYFFDDDVAATVASRLRLLDAMRNLGVERVALRAAGLSARSLSSLVEVIDRIRELEGLPKEPDPRHEQT